MKRYSVTFLPNQIAVTVDENTSLLQAQIDAGLRPDAPCGGRGTCGKCKVILNGKEILACQTCVDRDMIVTLPGQSSANILTEGLNIHVQPDCTDRYVLAYDIGTTTVVTYLMDGYTGKLLSQSSCINPQSQYGADVISRIEHVLHNGSGEIRQCIQNALSSLAETAAAKAGIHKDEITAVSIVGNTAMHHLLLGIEPRTLVTPPYMPAIKDALEYSEPCKIRILPNIAGFVGGDTVGCMVATRFDTLDKLTLLIDIGTNGEMVLGNRDRRIACSTAAGPAFEGAKISCGMRGANGAVDHVTLSEGALHYHVIGDAEPLGLCGSGLLDLVATLLDTGIIDESGRMENKTYTLCQNVVLTQKDVREVQLAKAAIRAGIELLTEQMGVSVEDIEQVYLAGAFGNYLTPAAACRIGMIPPALIDRIIPIGNAAGEGAKLCVLRQEEFAYSKQLAATTEFLELASLPQFQDCYVDALEFSEDEL